MDEDFDDGYGDVSDYGDNAQADFDAASSIGQDTYNDNRGGDSPEDYNSFVENLTQKQAYTTGRGATATNPFPESFFSRMFGADNVDYTNILGGTDRINEINDLRYNQAIGGMSNRTGNQYQAGDYYIGQDTNMGTVKSIEESGGIMDLIPGAQFIKMIMPEKGLPENDPRYQEIMNERAKSANDPTVFDGVTDYLKNMFGMGPKDSGASLAAGSLKEGQFGIPDNRTFDPLGNVQNPRAKFQSNISVPEGYETFINPYTGLEQMRKVSSGQPQGIGAFDTSNINPTSSININSPVRAPGRLSSEAMETARNQYSIPMSETVERDPKFEGFLSDTAFPPSLTSSNQRADLNLNDVYKYGEQAISKEGVSLFDNPNLRFNFGLDKDNNPEGKLTYNTNFFG